MGDRDRDVFLSAVLAGLEVVGMLAIAVASLTAAGLLGTLIMVTALLDKLFDR